MAEEDQYGDLFKDEDDEECAGTLPQQAMCNQSEDKLTISGVPTSYLREMVRGVVLDHFDEGINGAVCKVVRELVSEQVSQIVGDTMVEEVQGAVRSILAEGWSRTDNYGNTKGTATLRERVEEMLNYKRDYNSTRYIDGLVKTQVDETVRKELQPIVDAAKAEMKSRFDEIILATVAKTVREASGLRS